MRKPCRACGNKYNETNFTLDATICNDCMNDMTQCMNEIMNIVISQTTILKTPHWSKFLILEKENAVIEEQYV